MKRILLLLVLFFPAAILCQKPEPPSSSEIGEILAKSKEKVDAYRVAIKAAKDDLPPEELKKDISAADIADEIIGAEKKSQTAYGLVSLVTTLDDLTLDASRTETLLSIHLALAPSQDHNRIMMETMTITAAENGCYDISELSMHAALRYVGFEEASLNELLKMLQKTGAK